MVQQVRGQVRDLVSGQLASLTAQVSELRAPAHAGLPSRLASLETRVQQTAQACADVVKLVAGKQQAMAGSIAQLQKALLLVDGKCEGLAADVARGGSSGAGSWDIKAGRG
jgi:hypothetical protein